MEISGHGRTKDLATLFWGAQDCGKSGEACASAYSQGGDQVQISSDAKDIQRILELTQAPNAARAEQIERLRQAIDSGTYDVSGRKVADAIIQHVLTDAVL